MKNKNKSYFSNLMPDDSEPRLKVLVNSDKMWESFRHMLDKSEVFSKAFDAALADQGLQWDGNHIIVGEKSHKFKEGDWIVDNNSNLLHINNVFDGYYDVTNCNGENGKIEDQFLEYNYHLWTIHDAEPGNVLATEPTEGFNSPFVAIYKNPNEEDFDSYCFIGFDGNFYKGENGHSTEEIHPATKEQRDFLFSKMKENNYEWDPDNLRLKKIVKEDRHDGISTFPRNASGEVLSTFRETVKKYADALKDNPREKAIQAEIESWFSKPAPDSYKGLSDFEISLYKMIKYIEPFVVAHDNERIKIAIKAYSNQFGKILKDMEQIDKSSDVVPKFKIGDIIKVDDSYISYIIIDIVDDTYKMVSINRNGDMGDNLRYSFIRYQDKFKLVQDRKDSKIRNR